MDIEKVVRGLECHQIDTNHRINCADCPYYVDDDNHIRCVNDLHDDALVLLKEYEKLSKTLFKIDKIFRIKDLEFLVDGIENGSIVVLQDGGRFIGGTPINETTIKIRRF